MTTIHAVKRKKKQDIFYYMNVVILGILALTIIYPFYNCILVSVVEQKDYILTPFMLYPKRITWDAYKFIFASPMIFSGYWTTLRVILFGLPYNILLSILTAYGLSRSSFPGKKIITVFILFTMFFGGGLIPTYLLVRGLGLVNSLASIVLIYGINTFYMLVMRSYFESIPESIEESAKIDGANDIVILFKIILPLSMPILATFTLFYTVDRWNEWYNALIFITDGDKWPLQMVLRSIIVSTIDGLDNGSSHLRRTVFPNGVKMAAIVITMAPILLVYPFLQKYFVKGMLVGAVKS